MSQTVGSSLQRIVEWLLFMAVVAYFVFLFALNQDHVVTLQLWHTVPAQQHDAYPVLALTFLAGFAFAIVLATLGSIRRAAAMRRYRRRIADLEGEILRMTSASGGSTTRQLQVTHPSRTEAGRGPVGDG